jgi:hypothetical protein
MLTAQQRADKLQEAIALLQDADNCVQAALGASDVCYELHNAIENIVDELQTMQATA